MPSESARKKSKKDRFHSGFVVLAGRPNVGKSTFLNRVIGQKVAIVSPKAQTTRNRILGVYHEKSCQMVFLDTPGIHISHKNRLNQSMVKTALDSCQDVDHILYLVPAPEGFIELDWQILQQLTQRAIPVWAVLNKIDRISRDDLITQLQKIAQESQRRQVSFKEVIPLSALKDKNVDTLLNLLRKNLPEGPPYFPEAQVTDQSERALAAEIIREKLFLSLNKELPYSIAVETEQFEEKNGVLHIYGVIWVARSSQKRIVIGRQGAQLKRVGEHARHTLEKLFAVKIYLKLWVKVKKGWYEDSRALKSLGLLNE
ncbi:GTPase Era [Magnetococcales bacterium HHB-1]